MKIQVIMIGAAAMLAPLMSTADVARVYATTSDKGVRVYRVDDTRTWTLEKTVVIPNDGHVVKPVSCVHGAGCFYVLDGDSTASTASFSIHRCNIGDVVDFIHEDQ